MEETVHDVTGSKSKRDGAFDSFKVVASKGDVELLLIFHTIPVRMADINSVRVVMKQIVGDGDIVASVRDVDKVAVLTLRGTRVGRQVAVIYPDAARGGDGDSISLCSWDLGNLHVSDDDVSASCEFEADAYQSCSPFVSAGPLSRFCRGRRTASRQTNDAFARAYRNLRVPEILAFRTTTPTSEPATAALKAARLVTVV